MKNIISLTATILILGFCYTLPAQWTQQYSGVYTPLSTVFFIDQNTGWIGAAYDNYYDSTKILKTTNGGSNWFVQYRSLQNGPKSIQFIDQNTGWAVGSSGIESSSSIYMKTTNGGTNWSTQSGTNVYTSVYFVDQNTGWIAGAGIVMKSTNGGMNWSNQYYPHYAYVDLNSVQFVNPMTGWAAGNSYFQNIDSGIVIKTTNGGVNWFTQLINDSFYFNSLHFIDQNTGWVAGITGPNNGIIIKTTNGGLNWFTQLNIPQHYGYRFIFFIDQYTGWAVGGSYDSAVIIKTSNGGTNWFYQIDSGYHGLTSVFFVDQNTGWAVGAMGTILKTTNSGGPIGIRPISNKIPKEFKLYQNYPNPFNPTTTIEFEIASNVKGEKSNVKLIIYDILGREAATIVNEELKAGVYSIKFDGSNLSSGVYFYRLISGDFSETKKIVLIK